MAQNKTWNSFNWNQYIWNGGGDIDALPTSDEQISFHGYGLQNASIVCSTEDIWNTADRDINSSRVPNGHGQIINSDFYTLKTLTLTGMLHGGTAAGLETLIFNFKKELSFQNGNLDVIMTDGTKRRFFCNAKLNFIDRAEHFRVTSCPFEVTFECLVPFGQDVGYTSNNFEVSISSFEEEIQNPGNAPAEAVFLIVIEGSSVDATEVAITNQTTNQKIQIIGTFDPGAVIVFDGEKKEVTVNAVEVEFSGSFSEIQAGPNSILVDVTAVTVDYEFTWKVLGKYL